MNVPSSSTTLKRRNSSMNFFVCKTIKHDKEKFDIQVAKFIFSTNSAFNMVNHSEFIKLVEMLHPGYKLPTDKEIGNELLDTVYKNTISSMKDDLKNKKVCMSIDGWSNLHHEPVICIVVTDVLDNYVHLIKTINTNDNKHDASYLLELAIDGIRACSEFGCQVTSIVMDNDANMTSMRQDLAQAETDVLVEDIITYGCSSHTLHLLLKDIQLKEENEHIKLIIKYFRSTHLASAKYKEAGGKTFVLPLDEKWNTYCDYLESYILNWPILVKVCRENKSAIDLNIRRKVNDLEIKTNAEGHLEIFKIISVALEKTQSNKYTLSEVCEVWIDMRKQFEKLLEDHKISGSIMKHFKHRFNMTMTPCHYLANILDPKYKGQRLHEDEIDQGMNYLIKYHPRVMSEVLKFKAQTSPFKEYLFLPSALQNISTLTWWLALKTNLSEEMSSLIVQLHTAVASSAGLEQMFSTYGFNHSKVRNNLGIQKAEKLVTIFKYLNTKNNE